MKSAVMLDEISQAQGDKCNFGERWSTLVLGEKLGMFSPRHELHRFKEERPRVARRREAR